MGKWTFNLIIIGTIAFFIYQAEYGRTYNTQVANPISAQNVQVSSNINKSANVVVSSVDTYGFVTLGTISDPTPDRNKVTVIIPPNCPSAQAQRATSLANALRGHSIPVNVISSFSLKYPMDPISAKNSEIVNKLLAQPGLPVFIYSKVKINPSLDDVIFEYKYGK